MNNFWCEDRNFIYSLNVFKRNDSAPAEDYWRPSALFLSWIFQFWTASPPQFCSGTWARYWSDLSPNPHSEPTRCKVGPSFSDWDWRSGEHTSPQRDWPLTWGTTNPPVPSVDSTARATPEFHRVLEGRFSVSWKDTEGITEKKNRLSGGTTSCNVCSKDYGGIPSSGTQSSYYYCVALSLPLFLPCPQAWETFWFPLSYCWVTLKKFYIRYVDM